MRISISDLFGKTVLKRMYLAQARLFLMINRSLTGSVLTEKG